MTKMCSYVACIIVSVLVCNVWSKSVRATDDEPERCCWPNKFSGNGIMTTIFTNRNYSNFTEESKMIYRLAYDRETGLIGRKGRTRTFHSNNPKVNLFWEINDIELRQSYELNEKSNSCSSSASVFAPSVCIPETATYVGSNTTQFDNEEMITDTWMYTQNKNEDYTVYATVTRDTFCIPISTKIISFEDDDDDDGKIYIETLSNVVMTITNKNIVELPDRCVTYA